MSPSDPEQQDLSPAPPPWICRLRALIRLGAGRGHLSALAMIAYSDTPVGAYGEALSAELRWPLRITVPWIVVDSASSAAAGRDNWALPKQVASLSLDLDALDAAVHAVGTPPHDLHVAGRAFGPRVPLLALASLRQPGRAPAPLLFRGHARGALVSAHQGGVLAGRRPGLLLDGVLTLGAPGREWLPPFER